MEGVEAIAAGDERCSAGSGSAEWWHPGIGWLTPDADATRFSAQRGQATALADGPASRPLATDMTELFNHQTLVMTG